ncbi:putative DDE Tnp4 domain-containing protein [Phytophthora infestans]|uniref:Putative DDE Tnp4 domain-containing protein n=1 Tax=Phytophthora infestans TaxID=4787 RepID=A0A833TAH4_PHYIN|nr:putative DDE Tnp4 domain-containing protein [Phytophthora infestans]
MYGTDAPLVKLNCLKSLEQASWMDTWQCSSDTSLLATTSLTRDVLQYSGICRRGRRPWTLQNHHQVLELLFALNVGSIQRASLCKGFSISPSTLTRGANAAEDALPEALRGFIPARSVWPSIERQKELTGLVSQREPPL